MAKKDSGVSVIPAGRLVSVESGCYSDHFVRGVFVALRDVPWASLRDAWMAAHPEQEGNYSFQSDEFLASVIAGGYLLEVPKFVWHLEDYSRVSEMRVHEGDE